MIQWLKFISGSFFVNKYATDGARRGAWNAVVAFLIGWALIFIGLMVGYTSSFPKLYASSPLSVLMSDVIKENGLTVKVEDKKVVSGVNENFNNGVVINTFTNPVDEVFKVDGYNLIWDTRQLATTYDDFKIVCESKNGDKEISYEDYKTTLSDSAKNDYEIKVKYSGIAIAFTSERVDGYLNYLDRTCMESDEAYNAVISKEYKKLITDKASGTINESDYINYVYELYVKAYYPEIEGKDAFAEVPVVRTWYVENIFKNKEQKNYIAVLEDMLIGDFVADNGVPVHFNGYYLKLDGNITDGDTLVKGAFDGSLAINLNVYFINLLTITPLLILVPVILALIMWIVAKALKIDEYIRFGADLKIVCSFVLVTSLLTFLFSIAASFMLPQGTVYSFTFLVYCLILLVRTALFAIIEFVKEKRIKI